MDWSSNLELEHQYKRGSRNIKKISKKIDSKEEKMGVNKSIMNSMASGMDEIVNILHSNIRYNLASLKEKEIGLLSGKQKQVAELRQIYKPSKIAEIMKISPAEVTVIWNQAICNLQKIRNQMSRGIPIGLSKQQEMIYKLLIEDKTIQEISIELGITWNQIRVQKNKIENKIGKISLNEFI